MATTYKVLGQVNPTAATATTLYTVPALTQTVVSTISVCNLTAGEQLFRIAIRPAGETLAAKHYIAYDAKVAANDTTFITVGATLGAGDVITVYESAADITFNAFGSEIN
jgi:glucose-6-phosphate dehydrogenase assembly protein OpcA